jgi:hypothetical protein
MFAFNYYRLLDPNVLLTGRSLCKDAPDLSSAFRDFLPGAGSAPDSDSLGIPVVLTCI